MHIIATLVLVFTLGFHSLSAAQEMPQRDIDVDDIWILNLSSGPVYIELNSTFAPATVARVKALTRAGYFDAASFYRVIEGFVAQFGQVDEAKDGPWQKAVPAEFTIKQPDLPFQPLPSADLYADTVGYSHGFAVAKDDEQQWLIHCPGVVSLGRTNEAASGTSHIAIATGQSPRHLDRNMNVFGRVVLGLNRVLAIPEPEGEDFHKIESAAIASDLPKEAQPQLAVVDTESDAFAKRLQGLVNRTSDFFINQPKAVVDVCYPTRKARFRH